MNTTISPKNINQGTTPPEVPTQGGVEIPCILSTDSLSVSFNGTQAITNITLSIPKCRITAIIGPSGCGKSTLLKQFNRMNDFTSGFGMEGTVRFQGESLYATGVNTAVIRRRVGMVFQKPNVFPDTVFENVAWGVRLHKQTQETNLDTIVEESLSQANLWCEVKNRLTESALNLSGGQQQRLCIARALAMQPDVLLLDEPCSALDPVSTTAIEVLLRDLREQLTIVLVTHDLAQAKRVSDYTAFLDNGQLIEFGETLNLIGDPQNEQTKSYVRASINTE